MWGLAGKDTWRAVSCLQAFYTKVCRNGDGLMEERFGNEKGEVESVKCWFFCVFFEKSFLFCGKKE